MADTKQQWYKDAKYGLFIHWGLYSILAGEWKDPKTGEVTKTDRIAEWIENNLNIDKEDYRKLKDEFHPDKFDADMFVKRAKEQWGVKYMTDMRCRSPTHGCTAITRISHSLIWDLTRYFLTR